MQNHRIGMIGLGLMGLGIATNIVKKGFALTAMEHPGNQPLGDLIAAGAHTAPTAHSSPSPPCSYRASIPSAITEIASNWDLGSS